MDEKLPTYEEYKKATAFARFKYKYGLVVMILSWLLLLFIAIYMVHNGEALARNPLIYAADKYDLSCVCFNDIHQSVYFNGTSLWSGDGFPYFSNNSTETIILNQTS